MPETEPQAEPQSDDRGKSHTPNRFVRRITNAINQNPLFHPNALPVIARYTFRLHMISAILDAFLLGGFVFAFADIILKRALHASSFEIAIFTMLGPVTAIFSMHWSSYMQGKKKAPFFLIAGVFGRLILVLMIFCHSSFFYLLIFGISSLFNTLLIPTMNNIFQNNYPARLRGQIFGTVAATATAISLPMALLAGWMFEKNEDIFRWAFALAGIIGFISVLILRSIRIRHRPIEEGASCPLPEHPGVVEHYRYAHLLLQFHRIMIHPVKETLGIFKANPLYAKFEAAFMIYGFGFMTAYPVIPIWFDEVLHMRYDQISVSRTIASGLCVIFFSYYIGRIMDRTNPIKFCAIIFAVLAFYPLFIVLIRNQVGVILGFVVFGIGMVGINLAWNLSSIYFAGKSEVSQYMGAHVTLVGVRGTFGPLMSFVAMKYLGIEWAFYLSAFFFAFASYQMAKLHISEREKRKTLQANTE